MRRTYRNSNPSREKALSQHPETCLPAGRRAAAPIPPTLLADDVTLRDLLTPDDVENALNILRARLKKKNKRVALRVLKMYFGNAPKRKPAQEQPDNSPKGSTMKETMAHILEEMHQKYATKPEGGV